MIVIIDYGSGNLRSIQKSVSNFYKDVKISNDLNIVEKANAIILPGVGAFGDAVKRLIEDNLFDYLKSKLLKVPTLGICLGMQLLFAYSEETINVKGLNVIPGKVVKLEIRSSIRVPHTGWNRLIPVTQPYFFGYAYFNHSFYCIPEDKSDIISYIHHGISIPVILLKGNILGTQFHPEKSKDTGDAILKYFISLIRRNSD
jgi:glutamine amidotransferase